MQYRPIENFPGYRVGSDGTVWSCKERGGRSTWRLGRSWKKIKPLITNQGYLRVNLRDGKLKSVAIHRLVLKAFRNEPQTGFQCRHLNGVKTDNRLENLAWGSTLENHHDKQVHGTTARGERHGKSKLTAENVREIRRLRSEGYLQKHIAAQFSITQVTVSCILLGKTWKHA